MVFVMIDLIVVMCGPCSSKTIVYIWNDDWSFQRIRHTCPRSLPSFFLLNLVQFDSLPTYCVTRSVIPAAWLIVSPFRTTVSPGQRQQISLTSFLSSFMFGFGFVKNCGSGSKVTLVPDVLSLYTPVFRSTNSPSLNKISSYFSVFV